MICVPGALSPTRTGMPVIGWNNESVRRILSLAIPRTRRLHAPRSTQFAVFPIYPARIKRAEIKILKPAIPTGCFDMIPQCLSINGFLPGKPPAAVIIAIVQYAVSFTG
jgi:hypothetical protein